MSLWVMHFSKSQILANFQEKKNKFKKKLSARVFTLEEIPLQEACIYYEGLHQVWKDSD